MPICLIRGRNSSSIRSLSDSNIKDETLLQVGLPLIFDASMPSTGLIPLHADLAVANVDGGKEKLWIGSWLGQESLVSVPTRRGYYKWG